MKKLLLILLIFSGSTFAMEKFGVYKAITQPEPLSSQEAMKQKATKELWDLISNLPSGNLPPYFQETTIKEIKNLITQGANVNSKRQGTPLLFHVVDTKNIEIADLLLDNGADINAKDSSENSVVKWLIIRSEAQAQLPMIRFLIERGINLDAKGIKKITALMLAAYWGTPEVVKLLLEGASQLPVAKLKRMQNIYLNILPSELFTLTAQYVRNSANPNITDYRDNTALDYAKRRLEEIQKHPESYTNPDERIKEFQEIIKMLEPVTTKK